MWMTRSGSGSISTAPSKKRTDYAHVRQGLKVRDFTVKSGGVSRKRKGKREYLKDSETNRMMKDLQKYFESTVEIPFIRHGTKQRIETLINEEALLLAKYLHNEKNDWSLERQGCLECLMYNRFIPIFHKYIKNQKHLGEACLRDRLSLRN